MEPEYCAFIVDHGSPNPDSASFGPDEYCEEEALPDEEYCQFHIEEAWKL